MTAEPQREQSGRDELRSLLVGGLAGLKLSLNDRQVDLLLAFADLLLRWGRTYNLTAIRAARDVVTHHLLDCLAVVLPLQRELVHIAGRRVLDVGSGAGLPGIVIAIADPSIDVVCIDSIGKKAAFVSQAAASLGLKNINVLHGRVESVQLLPFDVIMSRAFSSLPAFIGLTEHLLGPEGIWLAMKGKVPTQEIAEVGPSKVIHVEPLVVPDLHADRCIVRIRRASSGSTRERLLPLDKAPDMENKKSA